MRMTLNERVDVLSFFDEPTFEELFFRNIQITTDYYCNGTAEELEETHADMARKRKLPPKSPGDKPWTLEEVAVPSHLLRISGYNLVAKKPRLQKEACLMCNVSQSPDVVAQIAPVFPTILQGSTHVVLKSELVECP